MTFKHWIMKQESKRSYSVEVPEKSLNRDSIILCKKLIEGEDVSLLWLFTWKETPQGFTYWNELFYDTYQLEPEERFSSLPIEAQEYIKAVASLRTT